VPPAARQKGLWGNLQPTTEPLSSQDCQQAQRHATLGGAGLVATLLKSMALRVKLMGRLGTDAAGITAHSLVHEFELGCKNIVFTDDHVTPAKMRFVNEHGVVMFRYDEERYTDEYLSDESHFDFDLFSKHAERADCVVIADYGKGYCHHAGVKIIEAARYYGALTVVGAKPQLIDEYAGADIVKMNASEAADYLDMHAVPVSPDRHELAQDVAKLCGAKAVFITASRNGTVLAVKQADGRYTTHHEAARPCFPHVLNCVGAGDAFLAGLVTELLLPPEIKGTHKDDVYVPAARLQAAAAAAAATAAQYLTRGFPEVEPATPFLASWDKRTQLLSANKIVPLRQAEILCQAWRSVGDQLVFTNGCFDLLHRGHVHLLEQAKQQGKRLIVAINSDDSVRLLKGVGRPVQDFETRAQVLASLGCVDAVVKLEETDFSAQPALRAMITEFVPDVLVKGAQYKEGEIIGWEEMVNRDSPGRIWRCPMVDNCSTTQTVAKVQNHVK
jgi:D-beta-D-heptose 7-phosphate kinase/D-beta-D-heptose 1-phosphate adenosyltransferase